MRYLVLSDIHANLAAFRAVLEDAHARSLQPDELWCLGDVVGYGPDPNECVELLMQTPHLCLAGNHDWAVLGKLDVDTFNDSAMAAILWTREQLTPDNLRYLDARAGRSEQKDALLVHGSPRHDIWEYVADSDIAADNFALLSQPICLVGHTHVPMIYVEDPRTRAVRAVHPEHDLPITLRRTHRYIVNPGSVGQPRDGDPRAAYGLFDTDTAQWTEYRVPYDVRATQERMRAAGLPPRLALRLEFGR
jgi:diadenosine tetraphosphatase ApaH/serine/threonine PP2A family protein phosphatase